MLDRFKSISNGLSKPQSPVGQRPMPVEPEVLAAQLAPDFTQTRLERDRDFANAVADTLPPDYLGAEEMLAGCNTLNRARTQFALSVEARNLLMILALVRWLRAFDAREYWRHYGAVNIVRFVEAGHIRAGDGRPLQVRTWQNYRQITEIFERILERIGKEPVERQDMLIRRVLEFGPSKLRLLSAIISDTGEERFFDLVLGNSGGLSLAGEPVDAHTCSVSVLKACIEQMRSSSQAPQANDPLAPVQKLRTLLDGMELSQVDGPSRSQLRETLEGLQDRIARLLEQL